MYLHKAGYSTIIFASITLLIINFTLYLFNIEKSTIFLIHIFSFLILLYIISFFRIPERETYSDPDAIIAPADGHIIVIEEIEEKKYLNSTMTQVSIFMSPLNIHVNRYPLDGKVIFTEYNKGKHFVAWSPKSSFENENTITIIENKYGEKILVRQIAGALARRIVHYSKPGDQAIQNNDMGFIRFGSRVDILFPKTYSVQVNLKQKVKTGITIIARKSNHYTETT